MLYQRAVAETERLIFCTWDESNSEDLVNLCKDPGLIEFGSSTYTDMTKESAQEFILKQNAMFADNLTGKFAVYLKEQNELIGVSGIFQMDDSFANNFEINYRFKGRYWGKGFGLESSRAMINYGFEILGLKSVYASVAHDNLRSQSVLRKAGMTFERNSPCDCSEQIWGIHRF